MPPRVMLKCHTMWHLTGSLSCTTHVVILLVAHSYFCVSSSLRIPLHPGLHNGLHWDPTGGKWKSGVHGSGPGAAAGGVTGQCPLHRHRVLILCVNWSRGIYFRTCRTTLGWLFTDCGAYFQCFSMFLLCIIEVAVSALLVQSIFITLVGNMARNHRGYKVITPE